MTGQAAVGIWASLPLPLRVAMPLGLPRSAVFALFA